MMIAARAHPKILKSTRIIRTVLRVLHGYCVQTVHEIQMKMRTKNVQVLFFLCQEHRHKK